MQLIKVKDYNDMCRKVANIISAQVILEPKVVLGLATGSTPIGVYAQLIQWYNKQDLEFSQVSSVNLDEYCGLSEESHQSYRYFMNKHLFNHINIDKKNTHVPNGLAENMEEECKRYDTLIEDLGGIDIQLLGLGHNGHVGFNEPSKAFAKETNYVKLHAMTIEANSRLFSADEKIPEYAITMGMKSIMQAKKIVLAVGTEDKIEILNKVLYGPITPEVPASILQLHNNLTVVTV